MSFGPLSAKPFQEWKSLSGKADPALGTHAAVDKPSRAEIRAKRANQTSSTFKQSSPSPGVAAVEASSAADAAAAFTELTKVATTLVAFTEKNDLDEKNSKFAAIVSPGCIRFRSWKAGLPASTEAAP